MRKRLLGTLVVALLTSSCGSSGPAATSGSAAAPPPQKVTIQLDWYPNPDHVGLYTGIDRGFFAAAGLAVQPISPSDVSDAIKLVAAGRVDLGISYEPELFFAQQQHIPATAVAAMVPTALNSIIARGDRGIHSVRDLQGKTVGVDGSASTDAFLSTVLAHAGLNPNTAVRREVVRFGLLQVLLAGKVDAIAGGFQNIEGIDAADRGLHPVIFPVDHYGVPTYDELVVIANSQRLADDPAYAGMVQRFVAALAKATNWARHHQTAAIAVMRKESYRDYQNDIARSVPATLRLLRTSALSIHAWNRFGMWMYRSGLLQSKPDAAALVHSMAP